MKKLLLVSLLVMSIALVGCKKAVDQAVTEPAAAAEPVVATEVQASENVPAAQ